MKTTGQLLAIVSSAISLASCAMIIGHPMTEDEFVEADKKCDLGQATFIEGNFFKGSSSIIVVPKGSRPSDWDQKVTCVAKVFGGDGVSKAPANNFMFRFES